MKNRYVAMFCLLIVFLIGCAHSPDHRAASKSYMIGLDEYFNRTFDKPWFNQEPFGYRDWFDSRLIHEGIFFQPDLEGRVLTLHAKKILEIPLPEPVLCKEIAVLCAGNFLYQRELPFTVELETQSGVKRVELRAFEWFPQPQQLEITPGSITHRKVRKGEKKVDRYTLKLSLEPKIPYYAKIFKIFSDGFDNIGQVGFTRSEVYGSVKSIKIINDKANNRQNLMIAAVTLAQ